jgi:3-hydroxy acid dehydrogenase / malonic semialdehyde reductase
MTAPKPLAGRVAVVTGASGGIGRAVSVELLRLGCAVHAIALDDDQLTEIGSLIGVTTHPLDVRDTPTLRAIVSATAPDILVNNAGSIGALTSAQMYDPATADLLIDINFRSAIHATLAALPAMVERQRGHVVFTGSIAGTRPTANTAVYSATKAALATFADGLRMDLFGTNVRTTLLAPGRVETNLYDDLHGSHEAAKQALYRTAKSIQPGEIAALVGVVLTMPEHVDVTRLEVVPTAQVYGGASMATTDPN